MCDVSGFAQVSRDEEYKYQEENNEHNEDLAHQPPIR